MSNSEQSGGLLQNTLSFNIRTQGKEYKLTSFLKIFISLSSTSILQPSTMWSNSWHTRLERTSIISLLINYADTGSSKGVLFSDPKFKIEAQDSRLMTNHYNSIHHQIALKYFNICSVKNCSRIIKYHYNTAYSVVEMNFPGSCG